MSDHDQENEEQIDALLRRSAGQLTGEAEAESYEAEGAEAPPGYYDDFPEEQVDPPISSPSSTSGSPSTLNANRALLIDISHFQPTDFPFAELKAEGLTGVYVRLSYGDKSDPLADIHLSRAKQAGLLVGGYHFLDGRKDADSQYEVFQRGLSHWTLELPPVIDVEEVPALSLPLPTASQVEQFANRLRVIRPHMMIYTSKYQYDRVGNDSFGCDLWVAHWEGSEALDEPALPQAWEGKGWSLWQFTDQSRFNIYPGELDTNRFNGDSNALNSFINQN